MTATATQSEHSLHIERSVEINAPPRVVWESLLDEIGPKSTAGEGKPMPMKLEPWPGGRWFRDLGNNAGHLWGHVQVIKPAKLLEITGPLFMSYAAVNHVQYRLTENGSGTRLTLTHRGFGEIDPAHRDGVTEGWAEVLDNVRKMAEKR